MRRTRTFVSMARMFGPDVTPDRLFQLIELPGFWLPGKHRPMDVFERVPACTPNNHALAVFFPFENCAGPDTELAANLGWHRDLTLRGDFGLRSSHGVILPR